MLGATFLDKAPERKSFQKNTRLGRGKILAVIRVADLNGTIHVIQANVRTATTELSAHVVTDEVIIGVQSEFIADRSVYCCRFECGFCVRGQRQLNGPVHGRKFNAACGQFFEICV